MWLIPLGIHQYFGASSFLYVLSLPLLSFPSDLLMTDDDLQYAILGFFNMFQGRQ
jgi:hypothetical protein